MSALAVVECNDHTCSNNDDGYCTCSWIEIQDQECMSYDYDPDRDGDGE